MGRGQTLPNSYAWRPLSTRSRHTCSPAALVRAARAQGLTLALPTEVREEAGAGLEGAVAGHRIRVGRYDWVTQHILPTDAAAAFRHRVLRTCGSIIFVAVDDALAGALLLEDPIRVETPRTLRA